MGLVEESFSISETILLLKNSHGETIFRISIPKNLTTFSPKELNIKVMSGGGLTQKGTISRTWNPDISHYGLNIYFADAEMHVRLKTLLIGAAFLMVGTLSF